MWFFLPAAIWGAIIFWIISLPPDSIPASSLWKLPFADKAIHFVLFAVFGALLFFGLTRNPAKTWSGTLKQALFPVLVGTLYGTVTEYIQYCCIDGRHGNVADATANFFGTVFGVFLLAVIRKTGATRTP